MRKSKKRSFFIKHSFRLCFEIDRALTVPSYLSKGKENGDYSLLEYAARVGLAPWTGADKNRTAFIATSARNYLEKLRQNVLYYLLSYLANTGVIGG